jgi:hypothetical protein
LDRDVTAQRSKDRNNCTTARSAAVGVLTGKVIRQLNRSHWETTPTYMPFQGGIIHGTFFRITTRSKITKLTWTLRRGVDFVPPDIFTTHGEKPASLIQEIYALYIKGS